MKLDEQNMYRQQTYRDKLNGGDVNKMLPLIQQPSSDIIKFYNFICISKIISRALYNNIISVTTH